MTDVIAPWPRPDWHATTSRAFMALFAFSEDPLAPGDELPAARFGVPATDAVAALDVRTHAYQDSPEWFDGMRSDALRRIADEELADPGRLDAARFCHSIVLDIEDPPDLGHLQTAWAVAGWLVERGCFAVLDGCACRWLDRAGLAALAPDRPFALDFEVQCVRETEPTPGFGHVMHTRGMTKFARPDLICGASAEETDLLARVLRRLAQLQSDGAVIPVGQQIRADERHTFHTVEYRPGENAPEVGLNNDGLLLVTG